jgi:glycosyltransferase involved in cell wall biosynthesis
VGKEGWVGLQPEQRRTLPQIMNMLENHPELGERLLWLPQVSDQYLQKIYGAVKCLLMASEGEGFGLPLIEAAAHHCPILARDIPVFREIAGPSATYFAGTQPQALSAAIANWLSRDPTTISKSIDYLTWQENVSQTWRLLAQAKSLV